MSKYRFAEFRRLNMDEISGDRPHVTLLTRERHSTRT